MLTRIVIIVLIAVLALPVATFTRPVETSPSPWGTVEAKGKKHKKTKQPQFTTVTRTERQTVTQTFASSAEIDIPAVGSLDQEGPANPYPATIEVSGFSNGAITDVNLILDDLTHTHPSDVAILLSRGEGRQAYVMSGVGSSDDLVGVDLTLDDEATAAMPGFNAALTSGTFQPTRLDNNVTFAAPAPTPNGSVALSAFDGADPNGAWQLWVMDGGGSDFGELEGWALEITAEVDVQVEEQVPAPPTPEKKHKKKGKGRR